MIVNRQTFFLSQQKLQNIPFNQTEEWFDKCGYNENLCRFFVDDISDPQIGCWGAVFKRRFIGEHLIIAGESYLDTITTHHLRDFYSDIKSCGFSIIEITAFQFYDTKYEIGIRRAGFLRPMIANLSPLTIVIPSSEGRKTHKIWNRNIRFATNAHLTFKFIEKPLIQDAEIFCNLFNELKSAKNLNYSLNPESLIKLFLTGRYQLFFVYNDTGIPIAGRIVYISGKNSFDVHAANSIQSRDCGASYFIIDEILKYLGSIGVHNFDYGMISPSNNEMDDIYRAKSYSGGIPKLYNGQWVFYKSKILEYLINGYFYLYVKRGRY
jgi:hypothetical protein